MAQQFDDARSAARTLQVHWLTKSGASAYHYFDAFASELMVAAVPAEHWHDLTVSLYGENRLLYSFHHQNRLSVWEERVIDSAFPPTTGTRPGGR